MTDENKTSTSSVELPAGGIPGLPQQLQVIFGYADGDPRNEPPGGKPGKYRLVFTLARPGIRPLAEYANSFEKGLKGDSHLAILPPAYTPPTLPSATQIRIYDQTQDGQSVICEGLPNAAGFLQKIVIPEIQAECFNDAETKGLRHHLPGPH